MDGTLVSGISLDDVLVALVAWGAGGTARGARAAGAASLARRHHDRAATPTPRPFTTASGAGLRAEDRSIG